MKPIRLVIQAFGPYAGREEIDFEKLSKKGMFLIKGPTGSGKTTIFDAMTFALYGANSGDDDKKGKTLRNDLMQWRCNQAEDNTPTVIAFTFSVHGHIYTFSRSLIKKRLNFAAVYEAGENDENGNLIPFFNNPKEKDLGEKAEELIGLTKEQFRQVVLLPQGQFERFLTASSGEKQEILEKIFETQQWGDYAQRFYEKAFAIKAELDKELDEVRTSLAEEKAAKMQDLKAMIEGYQLQMEQIEKEHLSFEGEKKQEALAQDITLAEAYKPLHEAEQNQSRMEKRIPEIKAKKEMLSEAERAEKLRDILVEEYRAQQEVDKRRKAADAKERRIPSIRLTEEELRKSLEKKEASLDMGAFLEVIGQYEAKKPIYLDIDTLRNNMEEARSFSLREKRESERLIATLETLTKSAAGALARKELAALEARNFRTRYYAGIYGEIASALLEGQPCPVCGSREHPLPAQKEEGSVSKAQLDEKENQADQEEMIWKDWEEKRLAAEKNSSEKKLLAEKANTSLIQAETAFKAARENMIPGIEDSSALEKEIQKLRKKVTDFQKECEELRNKVKEAQNQLSVLRAEAEAAKEETKKAEETLQEIQKKLMHDLEENDYADKEEAKSRLMKAEDRNALREEVVHFTSLYKQISQTVSDLKESLKEKAEPDTASFAQRQREIREEAARYQSEKARLRSVTDRLVKKQANLEKKCEHYKSVINQAESDLSFAKRLRGDTGIGLERYVLAIMFNQVIGEANRMLSKVHGGRYHLIRSDEKGAGNKRGLELKVHDNRSPETEGRGVSSLSGGEKFLVSLALSIGMSTVAQKSGVQIEALFIDEGFGTLDERSIQDAIEVLDNVRRSSGMIGIISHVKLLEDNIPNHLEVVKEDKGSHIVVK